VAGAMKRGLKENEMTNATNQMEQMIWAAAFAKAEAAYYSKGATPESIAVSSAGIANRAVNAYKLACRLLP
jgi:hypothetical protein